MSLVPITAEQAHENLHSILAQIDSKETAVKAAEGIARRVPERFFSGPDAIDAVIDAAPDMEPKEEAKVRKRAKKAYRRGLFLKVTELVPPVNELAKAYEFNAAVEAARLKKRVAAEVALREAEESAVEGDDDGHVDIAAIIADGVEAPELAAGGIRNDGVRLAYPGTVGGIVGPPEVGKTLIGCAQNVDDLNRGGRVMHLDVDHNGVAALVARYQSFGVTDDILTDPQRFRLYTPGTAAGVLRAVEEAKDWRPTFAVMDSVGELVTMFGGDSNSADDYTRVHRQVFTALANLGAAVFTIDHVAKTATSGEYATGTGAKKRAMDGVLLGAKLAKDGAFTPGVGGSAHLTILKDRHGRLRAASPAGDREPLAATFVLDSRGDVCTWEFWAGKSSEERAGAQLEDDVAYILALPVFPTSRTNLQAVLRADLGTGWSNDRAYKALKAAKDRKTVTFPLNPTNESKE